MLKKTPKFIFSFPSIGFAVFIIFNLWLQFIPLTNVTAYEFSAINSLLQSLFGGLLTIYYLKRTNFSLIQFIGNKFSTLILVFLIPLLISITNTLFFTDCPLDSGILFYLVLTLPSLLIGVFLGFAISKIFSRFNYLLFSLIYLAICFTTLLEFYLNPQVYFFNALVGFFPGNIYDENIPIELKLVLYRLLSVVFFFLVALFAEKFSLLDPKKKLILIIPFLLASGIFFWLKPELGYSTTIGSLEKELGASAESNNFRVIYDKSIKKQRISNFILQGEYYFEELTAQTKINFDDRITAIVFKDSEQKGKLFGAKSADVAKPWLNQFYVEIDGFESSLKHELIHIFAAEIGTTPFKVADMINPAMIEGYAMALENEYDGKEIHYLAALAFKDSVDLNIPKLFTGLNFFGSASSLSYILAGSFIKFLADNYGIKKVNQLYSDIDFQLYFNKDINELEAEFKEFLAGYRIDYNNYEADLYFGRLPLIKKVCARFAARKSEEGWSLYRNKKFKEALLVFKELWKYSQNYSSLLGISYTLRNLNEPENAIKLLDENINKFDGSSYYFNLVFALGDLLALQNNLSRADSVYGSLIQMNPRSDYYNISFIRKKMIEDSTISINIYLNSDSVERLNILKKMFARNNFPEYIPTIIELSQINEVSFSEVIELFQEYEFKKNEFDAYAAIYLYNYSLENSEFLLAKEFIESASNIGVKSSNAVIKQNLNKIEWLIKNCEQIKIEFTLQ